MYDAIEKNPDFHCCPVDYTNPPHIIMQNDRMISINNTTQIDLQGQAASESDGHRHISGTGGHGSLCVVPMHRREASRLSVCPPRTTNGVNAAAALCWT